MSLAILAQCEGLSEALGCLRVEAEELDSACRETCGRAEDAVEKVAQSLQDVGKQVEEAAAAVQECETALNAALRECELAEAELAAAQAALAAARSAASSSRSRGNDKEEEDDNAAEIARAEAEVAEAEARRAAAYADRDACAKQLEEARARLEALSQTREQVQQDARETEQMLSELRTEYTAGQGRVAALVEEAQRRLLHARQALDDYLRATPGASVVAGWLAPEVKTVGVLRPDDLHSRFRLTGPQMYHFLGYLAGKDPGFGKKVQDYRRQLHACRGTAEILQVQAKVRKYMSGYLGEAVAHHALRPYVGAVSTQARTHFPDGRYTKTDLLVQDLKMPVILGKGAGRYAPQGGSIGIEVKCGSPEYLYSQKEHLVFQSGGHKGADAAVTLCSADIMDLSEERRRALREELEKAGSPILGMLPRKDDMDAACWAYVNGIPPKE